MFYLLFELCFLIHIAPLINYLLPLFISSFLSPLPLNSFVYSWQKMGEYTKKYTGVYCHLYMTHVHILRGINSTSCTFVRGESHKGDAYTKGEKTFLFWEILVLSCFTLCLFYHCLWCFEFCLVSMLYYSHHIVFVCWTCIHPYTIVFYWLHVWMIICYVWMIIYFVIWSL